MKVVTGATRNSTITCEAVRWSGQVAGAGLRKQEARFAMDEGQDACAGREQRGTWAKRGRTRTREEKLKLLRGQSQRPPDAGNLYQKRCDSHNLGGWCDFISTLGWSH